jgi:transposase
MRVLHERCCGLDIHQKFVVACLLTTSVEGIIHKEVRTSSAMTNELLALVDWLREAACGPVVMESTGSYWRPLFNRLEEQCAVRVVNAYHAKAVPGRKTDVKDAEWLADLLRHGLLRASFLPALAQRHWRDLTRYRSHLVDERARLINRLQAVLEDANIKLASVVRDVRDVRDVRGLSAREILPRLLAGETDAQTHRRSPSWRAGSCAPSGRPSPRRSLVGCRSTMASCCASRSPTSTIWDYLAAAIARVDAELAARLAAAQEAIALLQTIPGGARRTAEVLTAEIGTDLSRFPSAEHRASWAGMCPGNTESGGRRLSGRTRRGNAWVRRTLAEVANVVSRMKGTYLAAQ